MIKQNINDALKEIRAERKARGYSLNHGNDYGPVDWFAVAFYMSIFVTVCYIFPVFILTFAIISALIIIITIFHD